MAKLSLSDLQQLKISQLHGVVNAMGWQIKAQDLRDDHTSVTLEMSKEALQQELEKTTKLGAQI